MSSSKTPNLFDFATSELSHDAFIAWLLSWSDPKFASEEPHSLSKSVIREFFKLSGKDISEITDVEVRMQFKNIDVLVIVTDIDCQKWAIIIENKIYTKEHSSQLTNYWNEIEESESYHSIVGDRIIGIYYKMWEQSNLEKVQKSGFKHFSRQKMMGLIDSYHIDNEIVKYYSRYLNQLQANLDAHKSVPVSDWSRPQWTGFYSKMKEELKDGNFGYVANPRGGFMGYWLGSHELSENISIYVQSEDYKLCVKLHVKEKKLRQKAKRFWHDKLIESTNNAGVNIVKPKVMRVGQWFTIGVLGVDKDHPWMSVDKNGVLIYQESINSLKKVIQVVSNVSASKDEFKEPVIEK